TFDVGLRLRGKVPANVQPGTTFAVSDLRATILFDAAVMTYGRPEPRFADGYLTPVKVALQGATATASELGDGYLRSAARRAQFGQPVAFEGAFDKPWATPQPPNTITAAAPAGGEVVVSFADARPIVFGEYGGGGSAYGPQMQSCALAPGSGSGVIARIPVGTAPVDQKPVVTKVSGGIFAGVGGLVTITGQRLAGGSVRIGGRAATKLATVGNTLYVWAPALGAGTYDVVVTTSKGASAVTPASKLRYARLF
ncbi:MAG: IPT/TIG domain-containing protein, partial [Solirubrobacteraceae bacterium]|nr:IPT/TIG domain-containing protein [Solirubrobacteraceae bacterium]